MKPYSPANQISQSNPYLFNRTPAAAFLSLAAHISCECYWPYPTILSLPTCFIPGPTPSNKSLWTHRLPLKKKKADRVFYRHYFFLCSFRSNTLDSYSNYRRPVCMTSLYCLPIFQGSRISSSSWNTDLFPPVNPFRKFAYYHF